jgi:hypothetical protein
MNVDEDVGLTTMTQDLLLLLLPFLSSKDTQALFDLCKSPTVLEDKNTGVQKRGYKILGKLIERGVSVDAESIIGQLDGVVDSLAAAAKKVACSYRFSFSCYLTYRFRIDSMCLLSWSPPYQKPPCI